MVLVFIFRAIVQLNFCVCSEIGIGFLFFFKYNYSVLNTVFIRTSSQLG